MWVRATSDRLRGGQELAHAEGWLALATEAGPTPARGPLTHDWLLPSIADPTQIGLNVFSHGVAWSHRVREALMESARRLGVDPRRLDHDDDELRYHGGLVWRDQRPTVKVYVSGSTLALDELAVSLGLRFDDDVFAIGVDVTSAGIGRVRGYRRAHTAPHSLRWPAFLAWAALEPPGLSHRVAAALDPPHAEVAKLSFDHIFGPEAEVPALVELANDVARLEPGCSPSFAVATLAEVADVLTPHGLVLRPVSYEVDVFENGTRQTDALVTVGEPLQ